MKRVLLFLVALIILLPFCSKRVLAADYLILAWNDLGMHCMNRDFSTLCILPPFNNAMAQVIHKGTADANPAVVTNFGTLTYEIPGNTYSDGKTNFWTYAQHLFGVNLASNIGLAGNGLWGNMTPQVDFYLAQGIPLTPFTDANTITENPFQLGLFKLFDDNHNLITTTQNVLPVSTELSCVSSGCHSSEQNILNSHEDGQFNNSDKPILCASCHADNALGTTGKKEVPPLSEVMHSQHAERTNDCYKCHPGPNTRCLRGVMFTKGLVCQDCHGDVANVGRTISQGRRPWLDEPRCGDTKCHGPNYAEESGKLFRQSKGHGGLYCSACHGSPHAIVTSSNANDNLQNTALQGFSGPLKDCRVCHTVYPTGPGPHGIMAPVSTPAKDTIPPDVAYTELKTGWVNNGTVTDMPNDVNVRSNLGMIQLVISESFNYTLNYTSFTPGISSQTTWNLRVTDSHLDAKAVVNFTDKSGNSTEITVIYFGDDIKYNSSRVDFGTQKPSKDIYKTLNINHNPSSFIHKVINVHLASGTHGFSLDLLGSVLPFYLAPNDSLPFRIKFNAATNGTFRDTVLLTDSLGRSYSLPIAGKIGTSCIKCSDKIEFGELIINTPPVVKELVIDNDGSYELSINGFKGMNQNVFTTDMPPVNSSGLFQTPLVIQPDSAGLRYSLTFTPSLEGTFGDSIVFITDADSGSKTITFDGIVKKVVGVQDFNSLNEIIIIEIMPIPVENIAKIKILQDNNNQYSIKIINAKGECIEEYPGYFSEQTEELILNTSDLPSGVYFVQYNSASGSIFKKFMISK